MQTFISILKIEISSHSTKLFPIHKNSRSESKSNRAAKEGENKYAVLLTIESFL
jgi:hypothetical protein